MSSSNHSYIAFLFRYPLSYYIRTCFVCISGRTGSVFWAKFQPDFLNPFALTCGCLLYSMISTPIVVFLHYKNRRCLSSWVFFTWASAFLSNLSKFLCFCPQMGVWNSVVGSGHTRYVTSSEGLTFYLSFLIPVCTILKSSHGLN